ncbi:HEAT repeat domain-containing protein [Flavobacterium cucumis]|uniref:Uncharacterized protein n=1 Tax=Flavobacterium cucumis TaxID=416016 RepID=A0A1M7ZXR7_9FLAO|nr:HEAT repeat domain-containing protein [Flavobacterium cucumis]SHO73672.1 hypothetical protein SAMN05443547_2039 [Flavobacterium cucumis]
MVKSFYYSFLELELEFQIILVFIGFFGFGSIFLLVFTLIKRQSKLNKIVLKEEYTLLIENSIFPFVFDDDEEAVQMLLKNPNYKKKYFKKIAIKYCINLHKSYTGHMQDKVDEFYKKSGLVDYSRNKLKSSFWEHKIEAIRDLSTLKDFESIAQIEKLVQHRDKKIATESILALIKLRGISELVLLRNFKYNLDEWSQVLILSVIKSDKISYNSKIEDLKTSKNKSIQLLSSRIVEFYKLNL